MRLRMREVGTRLCVHAASRVLQAAPLAVPANGGIVRPYVGRGLVRDALLHAHRRAADVAAQAMRRGRRSNRRRRSASHA
jgi:hypothetical protein